MRTRSHALSRHVLPGLESLESRLVLSTYTVTSLGDGAGVVTRGGTEKFNATTLRAAINAANDSFQDDTIVFASGLKGKIVLTKGELTISSLLALNGPGADIISVSAEFKNRVFHVVEGSIASIKGLTIHRGDAGKATGGEALSASHGGGIRNLGVLTIDRCVISENRGFADAGITNAGSLTIQNSTVKNNTTWCWGAGGVGNNGSVTAINSLITNNKGNHGGGIVNSNQMTLIRCTVSNNHAAPMSIPSLDPSIDGLGGAIRAGRWVTMIECTVSGNTATQAGGAFWVWYPVNAYQCTIVNNRAPAGGAYYVEDSVTLTNCTVSGNVADTEGGAFAGYGFVQANNSILCGNRVDDKPNDLSVNVDADNSHNNIVGVGGGLTDKVNGNRVGVSVAALKLGPLADNGGPTQTMPLLAGSLAINKGGNAYAVNASGAPFKWDQRGSTRIRGGTVDVGAYETQPAESVKAFYLVDAVRDRRIMQIKPGATIDLAKLPTRKLNIEAVTSPSTVGSVRFILDSGKPRTENLLPYALFGGIGNDFAEGSLRVGTHTLKATPFAEAIGKGAAGTSLKLQFTVVDSAAKIQSQGLFSAKVKIGAAGDEATPDPVV